MDFNKFQKQVPLFNRPKSRENIPDKLFPNCKSKKGFLGCVAFWYKKGISQWSKVSPKTALQGLSPDGLHGREPNLHIFFCNKWNSMTLG